MDKVSSGSRALPIANQVKMIGRKWHFEDIGQPAQRPRPVRCAPDGKPRGSGTSSLWRRGERSWLGYHAKNFAKSAERWPWQ